MSIDYFFFFLSLFIIPSLVHIQCYSDTSEKWICNGRSPINNLTFQSVLNKPWLIEFVATNFRLEIFQIDSYSSNVRLINASRNYFLKIVITSNQRFTSNLKHLILESNQIEQFTLDTVVLPMSLETISLANNRLTIIDARIFSHLPNLREIDLRHNLLKRISPQLFIEKNIRLDSNPLDCQCTSESYRTMCEKATTISRIQVIFLLCH